LADPATGKKTRLPSVTTLLGLLDKPALKRWAANTAADYATDNWDELAAQAPSQRRAAIAAAPWTERDKAAAKGTAIHALAERLLAGEAVEVPEVIVGKVNAVARFLEANPLGRAFTEARVWADSDQELGLCGYAGTADLMGLHPKYGSVLLDWKTGSGPWPDMALQLAGYASADWLVIDGTDAPMPRVDTLGIVMVRETGCELHLVDPESRAAARARFELLRAMRELPEPGFQMEVA
jgi:hypothetical protein